MNKPFVTIQELIKLFQERNYTEQTLGIHHQPGFMAARLRKAHAIMVDRSTNPHIPRQFAMNLPTTAYNERDRMQLRFLLDFNDENQTIRLREVIATLNPSDKEGTTVWEKQECFFMNGSYDLPDSKTIYERLTRHRLTNARQLIHQITQNHTIQKTL